MAEESLLRTPNPQRRPLAAAPRPALGPAAPPPDNRDQLVRDVAARVLAVVETYRQVMRTAGVDDTVAAQRVERVHDLLWQGIVGDHMLTMLLR